jgi:cell division protein FtsQ
MTDETRNNDAARYRRPRRPVEVRQRARWKQVIVIGLRALLAVASIIVVGSAAYFIYHEATSAELFKLPSLEAVEVVSNDHVAPVSVAVRFQGDVKRPVFSVPLAERRQQVEEIPWVETATVQRLYPNRLRVYLKERTPVAFLRQGNALWLIDRYGVILPPPEGASYSFPVLTGISETMPPVERRGRMNLYLDFLQDMDGGGKSYSSRVSEIDLSDPNDLRAGVPNDGGVVYLYFGLGRYQEKFETYLDHRGLWQQSTEPVHAIDLRYRGQIVLNPEDVAGGSQ